MILNGLIVVIFLFGHVASHGQVYSPEPRNKGYVGQGCYVSWDLHYLQGNMIYFYH